MTPNRALSQFFTPLWAAQALVEQFFGQLTDRDLLLDPTCGTGAFLHAANACGIPAFGVEIDPSAAAEARARTGRPVLVGDFCTIPLGDRQPTAIVGNPPFRMALIRHILDRAHRILPKDGVAGLVLPAYCFQTVRTVTRFNSQWSIATDIIPRELFHRLRYQLVFARFRKDDQRTLVGLALYREYQSLKELRPESQQTLQESKSRWGAWHALVEEALTQLGGRGSLAEIYATVAPNRLPSNNYWHDKIRQVLQIHYQPISRGVWALPAAA
jgi:site-specific DNA-methyltransferase (adenine-specific)